MTSNPKAKPTPYHTRCIYKGFVNGDGSPESKCSTCKARYKSDCAYNLSRINQCASVGGPDFRPICVVDKSIRCGIVGHDCEVCFSIMPMHPWITQTIFNGTVPNPDSMIEAILAKAGE